MFFNTALAISGAHAPSQQAYLIDYLHNLTWLIFSIEFNLT